MTQTAIIPSSEVSGNITSCGIETAQIAVFRDSAFSITQTSQYQSYNVCTGAVVKAYDINELTDFGVLMSVIGGVFGMFFLIAIIVATLEP